MGDRLIVSLTVDAWVKKGPGRPFNKWAERADMLRELRCVDEVIPTIGAVAAIREVRPTYFVKGMDYAEGKNWTEDVEAICREVGTELRFTTTDKTSIDQIMKRAGE
jgi:bifunctional ADP-heptose synthase (sugar kinase/adenylyltransferase)